MKRGVEQYLALPYTVESSCDEGIYLVKVKELPGCIAVGETEADALEMIREAMREWVAGALEEGSEIPLPEGMEEGEDDEDTVEVTVRLPQSLHQRLQQAAEKERVSLDEYLVRVLAES